ncbi:hypothetical protein DPMN_133371 [Dreissena polymorpha]|uniref:Uncharacterized protein n=1 Tax=Dreissena polymorpha TaxID=45954 RepID=A0A9D4FTF3_DREPO|nr:hypothetical protein DPMN_133371 [Dreissena polymorpha]
MRSRRSSTLTLDANSRRRKRLKKVKPIISFSICGEILRGDDVRARRLTRLTTPKSVVLKRKGPRSPFLSLTSPRRYISSPFKQSPLAKKSRKSLFSDHVAKNDPRGTDVDLVEYECADNSDINVLWAAAVHSLKTKGYDNTLLNFLRLVGLNKFPLNNVALALFADAVNWFSCEKTNEMRYSKESKMFWKLGYRLFGGRFLHFMGGNKNQRQIVLGSGSSGNLNPLVSDINFAVPHENVLRSFDPYNLNHVSNVLSPGVLHGMIYTLGKILWARRVA